MTADAWMVRAPKIGEDEVFTAQPNGNHSGSLVVTFVPATGHPQSLSLTWFGSSEAQTFRIPEGLGNRVALLFSSHNRLADPDPMIFSRPRRESPCRPFF